MDMAQLATSESLEANNLSFLIYSCVFIGKKIYTNFDDFFPIIHYEWREQEGWSLEEKTAFRLAHEGFGMIGSGNYRTNNTYVSVILCEPIFT